MRLIAPAISGAAVVLAIALVWSLRPDVEPPLAADREPAPVQPIPVAKEPSAAAADEETRGAVPAPQPAEAPVAGDAAALRIERAPLPGETPSTPMTNLMVGRTGDGPPAQLVEGEREFAAEPVDGTWAPRAEADVLATFAQMPGLKLLDLQVECRSTMCRLQLMQPGPPQDSPRPFKELVDAVRLEPRWMITMRDRVNAPIKSVAYLWRDGFAPPKPELRQPNESN